MPLYEWEHSAVVAYMSILILCTCTMQNTTVPTIHHYLAKNIHTILHSILVTYWGLSPSPLVVPPFTGDVVPLLATPFSSCEPSEFASALCWELVDAEGAGGAPFELSVDSCFVSTSVGTGMVNILIEWAVLGLSCVDCRLC